MGSCARCRHERDIINVAVPSELSNRTTSAADRLGGGLRHLALQDKEKEEEEEKS